MTWLELLPLVIGALLVVGGVVAWLLVLRSNRELARTLGKSAEQLAAAKRGEGAQRAEQEARDGARGRMLLRARLRKLARRK